MSRPVEVLQQDTKHVSCVDPVDATGVICRLTYMTYLMFLSYIYAARILANFENVYQKTREKFEEDIIQNGTTQNKLKVAVSEY